MAINDGWVNCEVCKGLGYLYVYDADDLDGEPAKMLCGACDNGKTRHDNYSDNRSE